jgi:RNA polymerase sigma factor (sigma-70 family)
MEPMWDSSDEALLAGFGSGDETAAAVFVRRFQPRVFGLTLAVLHDEGRAAEAAQDTFVRAWRHAGSFDPRRGSVTTWLLAIARNVAIDRRRTEAVRGTDLVDTTRLGLRSAAPGPEEAAVTMTEAERVGVVLASLPEVQRRCVLLATIGGRTTREIADGERIPLGTAKTRLRDGLLRARRALASEDPTRD